MKTVIHAARASSCENPFTPLKAYSRSKANSVLKVERNNFSIGRIIVLTWKINNKRRLERQR